MASRLLPWAHGTVVRADDVPSSYEYNLARVEDRDPGLDAEALDDGHSKRLYERLGFRTVWVRAMFTRVGGRD